MAGLGGSTLERSSLMLVTMCSSALGPSPFAANEDWCTLMRPPPAHDLIAEYFSTREGITRCLPLGKNIAAFVFPLISHSLFAIVALSERHGAALN
jgi:hypothetical protein